MLKLVILILAAGAFGGVVGGLTNESFATKNEKSLTPTKNEKSLTYSFDRFIMIRSVLLGIAASAAVPLFLSFASAGYPGLVEKTLRFFDNSPDHGDSSFGDALVFFGFCMIAAIAAQRFLNSVLELVTRLDTPSYASSRSPP